MTLQTNKITSNAAQPIRVQQPEMDAKSFFANHRGNIDQIEAIQSIFSSTTFEKTEVVLLADTCHPDIDQKIKRQALLSSIVQDENGILLEGFDKGLMIEYQNSDFHAGINSQQKPVIVLGWDHPAAYKESLALVKERCLLWNEAQQKDCSPVKIKEIVVKRKNLKNHIKFLALSYRNQSLVEMIVETKINMALKRIFVIVGASHVTQQLLTQLSKFKVAVISFKITNNFVPSERALADFYLGKAKS